MSQSLEDRMRVLEIVAQVLVVDFAITLEEDDFFDRLVAQLALTAEQRAAVVKRVNIGDPVELVAAQLGPESRVNLMRILAEAAAIDGQIVAREVEVIERIGAVLAFQTAHPGRLPPDQR